MAEAPANPLLGPPDVERMLLRVGEAFRPSAPITSRSLFAGRSTQIRQVLDAIAHAGKHAVIYGDRGVGKTSLANILRPTLSSLGTQHLVSKINCDSSDDFTWLWKKALTELQPSGPAGLHVLEDDIASLVAGMLAEDVIRPHTVRRFLENIPPSVFIFDEFDKLSLDPSAIMADLIKALSDYVSPCTLVIVGVAKTVDGLILDHASIVRAITQVLMPRMKEPELREILDLASTSINVKFTEAVTSQIVAISQGLPNYVHLLGLHSVNAAVRAGRLQVIKPDLDQAYIDATNDLSQTLEGEYEKATSSSSPIALYRHVLLACALAEKDHNNRFRPAGVRKPLKRIGKPIDIPQFAAHLKGFCSEERGPVLEREGRKKNYTYKFRNPLLEPYVVLKGLASGMITSPIWPTPPSLPLDSAAVP